MSQAPAIALFDIDGTLLMPGPGPRKALEQSLCRVFGSAGNIRDVRFGGKTDRIIVAEARSDLPPESDPTWEEFWTTYAELLDVELSRTPPTVLPGARELLERLDPLDLPLGLLTGNTPAGARLKLRHAGLLDFFEEPEALGAHAFDAPSKPEMGRPALEKSRRRYPGIPAEAHVLLGDTPADVRCAQAVGMKSVALTTGRFSSAELGPLEPDVLLESLEPGAETEVRLLRLLGRA